ncbi:MAG: dihydropteroate synthase [Anaerolineae bacterium]|nr:dihydropteroate synthase [Anaerolineae bacterium]
MTSRIFLSLGTNLGDRLQNLRDAIAALEAAGVRLTALSPVYETAPWGHTEQPAFLNMAAAGRTALEPAALLQLLKQVEGDMGREPAERWGPRLIDIDLLFYDDLVLDGEELILPHPRLHERAFVLVPLAEIAPDLRHRQYDSTVAALRDAVQPDRRMIRRLPLPLLWGRRTHVMGILNVTPDSFSGDGIIPGGEGGEEALVAAAVQQAEQFVADGADIIDVGGESTRPGSQPVDEAEEMARVLPVIRALHAAVDVPISVDTYRANVAAAALEAGASWINDVWGLRMDREMAPLVARSGAPVVIMHNRSRPRDVAQEQRLGGRYVGVQYDDLMEDIRRELQQSVDLALSAGAEPEQIILDPGVGFGKTVVQNLRIVDELHRIKEMGYPVLLGTSRKSFIGYTLDLPPEERMEGTAATVAIGIDRGADIVRVHDVRPLVRVARMTDQLVRNRHNAEIE